MSEFTSFVSVLSIFLEALQRKEVCRLKAWRGGWNGKNQYVKLQQADGFSKMTQPYLYLEKIECGSGDGSIAKITRIPWLASQADMLEDDWCIHFDEYSTGQLSAAPASAVN